MIARTYHFTFFRLFVQFAKQADPVFDTKRLFVHQANLLFGQPAKMFFSV